MVTSFLADSIEVLQVKQAAEARFGSKPNSPSDFAELSLHIKMATNKDISSDTLNRLWGYKKGYTHTPFYNRFIERICACERGIRLYFRGRNKCREPENRPKSANSMAAGQSVHVGIFGQLAMAC